MHLYSKIICKRCLGASKMRTDHCGMWGVIHMLLMGSRKYPQLQFVVPFNWTKESLIAYHMTDSCQFMTSNSLWVILFSNHEEEFMNPNKI